MTAARLTWVVRDTVTLSVRTLQDCGYVLVLGCTAALSALVYGWTGLAAVLGALLIAVPLLVTAFLHCVVLRTDPPRSILRHEGEES